MKLIERLKSKRAQRNEKWHIIDNLHDLPVGKYLRILEIGRSDAEDIDKSTAVLEVITGWSASDIEALSLTEYSALASGCGWLYAEPQPTPIERAYRVGDFVLRPTKAEELTTAQFIDFQQFANDADNHIIELLSVLLVPQGKRYGEGYDVAEVRKWIAMYLPTDTAISLIGFFLHNAEQSSRRILTSLERDIKTAPATTVEQMQTKARALTLVRVSLRGGDGCSTSEQ